MPAPTPVNVTVRAQINRADLLNRLRLLPRALAGQSVRGALIARKAWRALGVEALTIIREAFLEKSTGGTDQAGRKWLPLSPRTIQQRARQAKQQKGKKKREARLANAGNELIGIDTGELLDSLSPGKKGNVLEVDPGMVRIGSAVEHAGAFHAERPMWPDARDWPMAWTDRLGVAMGNTIAEELLRAVQVQGSMD